MLKLKLKLQYFGHLMWRADSLEKTCCWERLKAGGEGDDRRWDGWMVSSTQWTWVWKSSRRWWRTGKHGVLQTMGSQRVWHHWATEQQKLSWQNLTMLYYYSNSNVIFKLFFSYFTLLSLSYGTWDLGCIMWDLSLRPAVSSCSIQAQGCAAFSSCIIHA